MYLTSVNFEEVKLSGIGEKRGLIINWAAWVENFHLVQNKSNTISF